MKAAAVGLVLNALAAGAAAAQPAPVESAGAARRPLQQTIRFDDIAPKGMVLQQCWNATGIDDQERVYIGFTGRRADGREDFAVFRYDPATGSRRLLGSFLETSQAAGNLHPGEEIPKGHTHLVALAGRIYMGSQGFHDFKRGIGALPRYRGSRLRLRPAADVLEDVSRSLPGGVVTRHTGIIALTAVPGGNLLAGLEHPSSNMVLFDTVGNRVQTSSRHSMAGGQPAQPRDRRDQAGQDLHLSRHRGAAAPGAAARHLGARFRDRREPATTHTATGGSGTGRAAPATARRIFLSTVNGELYRLDDGERPSHASRTLPAEGRGRCRRAHRPALRHHLVGRQTRIYGVPRRSR